MVSYLGFHFPSHTPDLTAEEAGNPGIPAGSEKKKKLKHSLSSQKGILAEQKNLRQ